MIQFKSQWVSSGKIHKKTQAEIGFFRGVIDSGAVVRCTLQRFSNGEDAELHALALVQRARGIFPDIKLEQKDADKSRGNEAGTKAAWSTPPRGGDEDQTVRGVCRLAGIAPAGSGAHPAE